MTSLAELVERHGSPLYVYELDAVRAAHGALRTALPRGAELYYSLKANPHPLLVRELGRLGCGAEVSSASELQTAINAGIPPARCLYTGPGKTRSEMAWALAVGVTRFSVESCLQLGALDTEAERAGLHVDAILRVNPDRSVPAYALEMAGTASPFGVDTSWIAERAAEFMASKSARLRGFHFFVGTNIRDAAALPRIFAHAIEEADALCRALGVDPVWIDLGGGFAHPFAQAAPRTDYSALRIALETMLDAVFPRWRDGRPAIAFESGRYLVGGCGTLVCTVQDVKVSKGRRFVVLDSGIHHLGGMSGLRRVPPMFPALVAWPEAAAGDAPWEEADVVGSLCTPLDSWARGITVPPVSPGDLMLVPNVGAYGLTASLLAFLSRETPLEVILDHAHAVDVSQLVLHRRPR